MIPLLLLAASGQAQPMDAEGKAEEAEPQGFFARHAAGWVADGGVEGAHAV